MNRNLFKLLSYRPRHAPEAGGLTLDGAGWASVQAVRYALFSAEHDPDPLEPAESDKQRFELSTDPTQIRARQKPLDRGRSRMGVGNPARYFFHGTVARSLGHFFAEGLKQWRGTMSICRQKLALPNWWISAAACPSSYGSQMVTWLAQVPISGFRPMESG